MTLFVIKIDGTHHVVNMKVVARLFGKAATLWTLVRVVTSVRGCHAQASPVERIAYPVLIPLVYIFR